MDQTNTAEGLAETYPEIARLFGGCFPEKIDALASLNQRALSEKWNDALLREIRTALINGGEESSRIGPEQAILLWLVIDFGEFLRYRGASAGDTSIVANGAKYVIRHHVQTPGAVKGFYEAVGGIILPLCGNDESLATTFFGKSVVVDYLLRVS